MTFWSVSLLYDYGKPTGQALLGMATPEYSQEARNLARKMNLYGSDISAEFAEKDTPRNEPGFGPSASVEPQTAVLLTGLPYIAPFRQLKHTLLRGFELATDDPLSNVK